MDYKVQTNLSLIFQDTSYTTIGMNYDPTPDTRPRMKRKKINKTGREEKNKKVSQVSSALRNSR